MRPERGSALSLDAICNPGGGIRSTTLALFSGNSPSRKTARSSRPECASRSAAPELGNVVHDDAHGRLHSSPTACTPASRNQSSADPGRTPQKQRRDTGENRHRRHCVPPRLRHHARQLAIEVLRLRKFAHPRLPGLPLSLPQSPAWQYGRARSADREISRTSPIAAGSWRG